MFNLVEFIIAPYRYPDRRASATQKIKRYLYKRIKSESAGTVIYRKDNGKAEYLLIHRGGKYQDWMFSKGRMKEGEGVDQVAKKAALDEVGLKVDLVVTLPNSGYTFYDDEAKELVDKRAYFFLAKPESFEVKLQHQEGDESMDFLETKWATLDEALDLIKYPQEKRIIKVAEEEVLRVG